MPAADRRSHRGIGPAAVIGQLEEFASAWHKSWKGRSWDTRREIIRALVKRVEIDEQEVRIVYRVSPSPFEEGPQQAASQHCWGRDHPSLRRPLLGSRNQGSIRGRRSRSRGFPATCGLASRALRSAIRTSRHLNKRSWGMVSKHDFRSAS